MNRGRRSKYAFPILQVHAIRFMADMRAALFVRSHVLFSYEFLNRALFYLNKVSVGPTIPGNIRDPRPYRERPSVTAGNRNFHS